MATTSLSPVCPDCGAPLPPESPYALCAACLLRQALSSQTRIDERKPTPFFPPHTPEEIADRFPGFEILECLGRGGMGVVYKARQKSLDRWVAIKIVAPEKHGEERFSGRFAQEAATLAKLSHPNIVTIHDFGETDGLFYIVMEFVDGVNLRDLVSEGRLAPEQALAIVPPICDALQYAHEKGVVHRDIKPENILLDRDGRVRIADFGIAALMGGPGEPAGTPPYAAPEQTVPNATADHRADIHALGVVFYEMLTGERPSGEIITPSKRRITDTRLDEMVRRAMAKNPADRFQTAGDFRTAVDSVGKALPVAADGKSLRKWFLPAAALLVLGSIGYLVWQQSHPPEPPKPDKPAINTAADAQEKKDLPLIDASHTALDDMKALIEHSINPEQAAILLERGRNEIKGESRRSSLSSLVISYLCNQGYAEEAWNLISPDAGKVREAQVAAWFNSSKPSLDTKMKRLERLSDPSDRETAMAVLFDGSDIDEICALEFNTLIPKSTVERQRVFLSLYRTLQTQTFRENSEDTTKLLRKCLELAANGWLSTSEAAQLFSTAGDRGSFTQWEIVEGMKWDLPKNSYERVREAIVKNMAAENPERAIRTLVVKVPLKQRQPMLSNVYQKMREDAPATCVEKVRALLPEFDPETIEQLSTCVIRGALQTGELEVAKEWMPRISNVKLRLELADGYASALEQRKKDLGKGFIDPKTTVPRPY